MSEDGIKVTDKRMFTEKGELREEYRDEYDRPPAEPRSEERADSSAAEEPTHPPRPSGVEHGPPREEGRETPPAGFDPLRDLGFMDLVALLAEPVPLFLGDAALPGGESAEDLERARLHIDLLQVLREKTQGNVSRDEDAVLADLIYQLRMRYVQKRR